MWLACWSANFVDPIDGACQAELDAEQAGDFAERALESAFGRSTIVADDVEHERVVQLAGRFEAIDQAADMMIGVCHEGGVVLHEPQGYTFF